MCCCDEGTGGVFALKTRCQLSLRPGVQDAGCLAVVTNSLLRQAV